MEQSRIDQSAIASLKDSVDRMVQIVEGQGKKRDESDMLMHILSSKVDLQGQRLINLENDVRLIKDTVLKHSESLLATGNATVDTKHGPDGDSRKTTKDNTEAAYFDNKNKVSQFSQEITEVKCLVREEVRGLANVSIKCSTDVTTKLDQADKAVFGPLIEATSDLKHVLQRIEDIDRGIRTVENATNQYVQSLTTLKDDSVARDCVLKEINKKMDKQYSLIESQGSGLVKQLDAINKKDCSLNASATFSGNDDNQSIKNVEKLMTRQYHLIIEQILAESQITREIVQNTRKARNTYKLDFYIHDFSKNINLHNKNQLSNVLYIDQTNTHFKIHATFKDDGKLEICLVHGRNPRKLGLDTKREGPSIGMKVFAVKLSKRNWELGYSDMLVDEANIDEDCDGWDTTMGTKVATVSCSELTDKGYIDDKDRLLLRFVITIK